MSDRAVYVCVDLDTKPVLAGTLYARFRNNRESATFTYDASWLSNPSRFALEPALVLYDLSHHTPSGPAIFGAFGDSTPDRWGRTLMRRAERQRAKAEKRPPRPLSEIDCLLGVDDETRQGALRFAEQLGGPFLAVAGDGPRVPPLVELPALLAASDRVASDEDDDDDLRLLLKGTETDRMASAFEHADLRQATTDP
jgi:serine/threonine-protein kinase HipA